MTECFSAIIDEKPVEALHLAVGGLAKSAIYLQNGDRIDVLKIIISEN
jgi:hypothetical protein